jgi:hypothetical protein
MTSDHRSNLKLKRELEAAAIVERIRDLAEGRGTQVGIGIGELRRVQQIDRFGFERGGPV